MERLEKIVNKYNEENKPLITKSVQFPIAEEVIEVSSDEEESFEEINPRTKRIINFLNGPWNFLENDKPYNTLCKSILIISCLTGCIIGGISVYHMYF